ncbi:hypothetical protein DW250_08980 [Segatella copri]|uniref:Uncharacterized protein n=1 Tax=Segatella copri TaxID=165179 RepID=A0A3R6E3T9_9BACT|nr:hypothetical protein DW250_08980 [Segatella copri]
MYLPINYQFRFCKSAAKINFYFETCKKIGEKILEKVAGKGRMFISARKIYSKSIRTLTFVKG